MACSVGKLGGFGDARRAEVGDRILDRVVETGSLVIRTLGGDRAGEVAMHRFLEAPSVTCREMCDTVSFRTSTACDGRRILAIQDTTEINFAGRDARRRGLGPAGDGVSAGFFIHPVIAVDIETEAVLGLVDINIWTRSDEKIEVPRHSRRLEEKESWRWLGAAERAAERLKTAASVIVVGDRENDIYSIFARRPPNVDLLIRAAQDRTLVDGSRLFSAPESWLELGKYEVKVASRGPGDPGRKALVAIRAGTVTLRRPCSACASDDAPTVTLRMVEAREIGQPDQGEPLLWRLLTTLDVETLGDAQDIVHFYRLRWRIEEVFRALKSDGLQIENIQMQDSKKIFKLALIGLAAATRTIQLVDARDGSPRPATDVIDPSLLPAAEAIAPTLEGKTQRQKNPHPPRSLAWLSWIIARLGGWNCYYKPPGPKTMRAGWNRFAMMAAGFALANAT